MKQIKATGLTSNFKTEYDNNIDELGKALKDFTIIKNK